MTMQLDSANMRQQANNYNATRCSIMSKDTINPLTIAMIVIQRMRQGGMHSAQSLKAAETALYCLNALEAGDTEGIEINRISKKLGFKVPSTALRIFYQLADNPEEARGGNPLGWFTIRQNLQDGRYMNLMLSERGSSIKERLLSTGSKNDPMPATIAENVDELRSMSKTHHHLEVETGKFSWRNFESKDWGKKEDKPIPYNEGYLSLPMHERKEVQGEGFWWVDEKSGYKWQGNPEVAMKPKRTQRRNYTLMTRPPSVQPFEAINIEASGKAFRTRNQQGEWELYKVDADVETDRPVAIVGPMSNQYLDKLIETRIAEFLAGKSLDEILSAVDYEVNKKDFNKFRTQFSNYMENSRRKQEEVAYTKERAAQQAEQMSRKTADDANETMKRAHGVPVHMLNERQEIIEMAKHQANQYARDSAAWEEKAAEERNDVEVMKEQIAALTEALAKIQGKD